MNHWTVFSFIRYLHWVFFIGVLACGAKNVLAGIDAYEFDSEVDRARYQRLAQELRCPKCQNQNLSDSNSAIAIDLRNEVARMIREGRSDSEIKTYMVNRYGDFVLYRPPIQNNTLVLWWAPAVMLFVGLCVFVVIAFRRRRLVDSGSGDVQA
ncbi:cytochrome c-type biogenesis protein [Teredinibacter purpureus]|uniref:cytochrome c-type biogenesis protein n=1 Tax=Teredinibacter purpureus TaxID=2731756 RepID=UPI000AF2D6F1|nr:cytochrome c-type biogenesis protein [Teredinibacter purpureus]